MGRLSQSVSRSTSRGLIVGLLFGILVTQLSYAFMDAARATTNAHANARILIAPFNASPYRVTR